ncbi:MAG: hypothetical protein LBL98_08010 [Ruminococcus sp.]|jgi:hypothetical protein|nr:hypothetical protein [Ruminococcus sp.]
MKKEDLIAKAAERGILLDEEAAKKYINLSEEELENLSVSGGCETQNPYINQAISYVERLEPYVDQVSQFINPKTFSNELSPINLSLAERCAYYGAKGTYLGTPSCAHCTHSKYVLPQNNSGVKYIFYCMNKDAWS